MGGLGGISSGPSLARHRKLTHDMQRMDPLTALAQSDVARDGACNAEEVKARPLGDIIRAHPPAISDFGISGCACKPSIPTVRSHRIHSRCDDTPCASSDSLTAPPRSGSSVSITSRCDSLESPSSLGAVVD